MIAETILGQIIVEWAGASYGCKLSVVERWATVLGVGRDTVYRAISNTRQRTKSERVDKGKRMNPHIDEWVKLIWGIKLRPPAEGGVVATDQALQLALSQGIIPAEAADIPISSINRIARDLDINRTGGRFSRFQAKYANLTHQFDASSSKFLYVARRLPDGDRILKLHRPAEHYKNKPVPIRERPWIYGVTDDYSGLVCARYIPAEGENAADGMLFLEHAWGKSENNRLPFRGLPRLIYMDNGPLKKALPIQDFFKRLDVTVIPSTPYVSRARGKIERPWRTLFSRFELPFFCCDDWKKFEITLSELNRRLQYFLIESNSRPHRYRKELTREQMWRESINDRGGVVDIPPHALATIFQRSPRTVKGGYFVLETTEYEVAGLDEGRVWVYEGIFDDRLIVEDVKTHKKYEVKLFKPQLFGQRLEIVKSEAEKIVEESRNLSITNTLYTEAGQSAPAKVSKLPVRVKEERELVDPLSVGSRQSAVGSQEDEGERLFASERERYEWLLDRREAGPPVTDDDIEFMKRFEKSTLYGELKSSYERWNKFERSRAAG